MLDNATIGVVVPAYNEELLISKTLETMPSFVDRIFVINDASTDRTAEELERCCKSDPRIHVINHETNQGLGQSLIDGYLESLAQRCDVTAVMAGDAQMAPDDLPNVVGPVARGEVDYVKGNRLLRDDVVARMPAHRYYGNNLLTLLTKFATGYWRIIDPQCGYTAISLRALESIPIADMIKGYGYNAHILNMLNLNSFTVRDVEVQPVYGQEQSKIKLKSYIPTVSRLLVRLFARRMWHKYAIREFHPLIFFYLFGTINLAAASILAIRFVWMYGMVGEFPQTTAILLFLTMNSALLNLFLGMWMDMEENRRLDG